MSPQTFPFLLFTSFVFFYSVSGIDFTFNSFNSSILHLLGDALIQSSILTLTNDTTYSIGRSLYPHPIPTRPPNSSHLLPFSTSFIFSISPYPHRVPAHGFAFIFVPTTGIQGAGSAQFLGLLNFTNNDDPDNHLFAVEFDVFKNQEFNDPSGNHVGVNVNSLSSKAAHEAGFWVGDDDSSEFRTVMLNNGENYQVWIDYFDSNLNVTMARAGLRKPKRPLVNVFLDLSDVFLDQMYVGFSAATGKWVEAHMILSWSFSNSNFSIGDALVTKNLPSFVAWNGSVFRSKGFIVGVSVGSVFVIGFAAVVFVVLLKRKKRKAGVKLEDWELEYWPHRMDYQEIYKATNGFSEKSVIGCGGNGKVFRGVLVGGVEVAIKCISLENEHGMREFLAEVSSLGRLKHRNLVGLRGWCKREKRSLILVYDYMENGSLDKRLFGCEDSMVLSWEERIKVLKDVACGVLYLHEGWESRVLHRDIKASNVLLDKDMNARLGDFGFARMHNWGELPSTTQVVGTVGYTSPEFVRTGRASVQTDVYGFGILVLEVVCGRGPIQEGKPGLIDLVSGLMERGELISALDERLKAKGGYSEEEVERVLHLGLLCVYPDPSSRPTMRQILKALEGTNEGTESEGEAMEASLLDRMKTTTMWSNYRQDIGRGYPTYEEIKKAHSFSMCLSVSDILSEG
ncbi:probable L-type lectin-domain containing receptor kinase VII.2 [Cornus florida]|uniref:probable L-type lectin-domain containing receptor kinase VII.2 n=1 Tax=Cornus florida TaxID=4283 RepID=UPI00289CE859|nr:probable L-type lectin-domain containing receptor kinase VII.2 [Cornus florida]